MSSLTPVAAMSISRRRFLQAAAVSAAAMAVTPTTASALTTPESPLKTKIYKAILTGKATDENCAAWKAAGYEGLEITNWNISVADARAMRLLVEKHDMRVSSVMRGWASFNATDPDKRQATIEETKTAIRVAAALGADTVLLVPCRIDTKPMPQPWEFEIDFDPKTLHIKTVVAGDNAPYADYIKSHDAATDMSIDAVEELIPVAAREGVRIGLENVWNNLWVTPNLYAAFVRRFDSPWVGTYFDLGNHTRYARCEEYLKVLGTNILKLHIKGYKVVEPKNPLGGGPGDWCAVDQASIDWPLVRRTLDTVNHYNGFIAVEEGKYDIAKYSAILDRFIEGKPLTEGTLTAPAATDG